MTSMDVVLPRRWARDLRWTFAWTMLVLVAMLMVIAAGTERPVLACPDGAVPVGSSCAVLLE